MNLRSIILLLLIPLSESKALFYNSDKEVDWYLFSDNKRYLCNVVEDYSNMLIFGIVFYYLASIPKLRNVSVYLFVLNLLDLFHLGLMDMQYFVLIKLFIAYFICILLKKFSIF